MSFVPIVVEAKPDELLYSWINRLAGANSVRLDLFINAYMNQKATYIGDLPYDIRSEFASLVDHINKPVHMAKVYEDHSTMRFDLMFLNERPGLKIINNVCLRPDAINTKRGRNIDKIHICPECIKADKERFGFPYLHVSHHLRGVKTCSVHDCILWEFTGSRGHECDYDLNDYKPIATQKPINALISYSKYAFALSNCGKNVSLEVLKYAYVKELNYKGYALHGEGYERFSKDFSESECACLLEKDLRFCFTDYLIKKKPFEPEYFISLLMFLFPDPAKLIEEFDNSELLLIDSVCKRCEKTYISYKNTAFSFGLCRDCYRLIPVEERFNNMVEIIGNGEYKTVDDYSTNLKRIRFKHKCGRISSFVPDNFLYAYSRCECEIHTDKAWLKGYKILENYYNEFGTSNIPKRKEYKGYSLGQFCQTLRKNHDDLTTDKLVMLDKLNFDFAPIKTVWDHNIDLYNQYVINTKSGHIERSVTYKGFKLGAWYSNQRRKALNGTINEERLKQIRSINPEFPEFTKKEKKVVEYSYHVQYFEDTIKLLLEYQKEYGTLIVPKRFNYKGYNLGPWCQQMRSKRRLGILPEEQVKALDDIGFIWDALGYKWNEDMNRYRDYVKETGNYEVSREVVYKGFRLGYWYNNLKAGRRNGTFTDEQKKDIESINPNFFK